MTNVYLSQHDVAFSVFEVSDDRASLAVGVRA